MSSRLALAELPQLERRTLADTAYEALADLLASGRLAPGDRLSLRQSAAALGVSVMPVREAVSRLVADGVLEVAPTRAIRVPIMTARDFRALAETRMAIEGLAAARTAEHRSEAELAAIRRAEAAFRAEAGSAEPDCARAVRLNRDLHFAIYAACGLAPLQEVIARLWLKAGPVINLDLRAHPERLLQGFALQRHAEALVAIEARDGPAAAAALAADIREAADFILSRGGLRDA
ncbi:GntR family transcriptional regulator [Methylobacterium pseudosasicola]|uniref:DNA-binding transcriptional regulator, GntR family n=1 Tax=Methylobacterium pseudosasicola TaxID=582667 RepID=A0A1I4J2Z6_9HYPH|nr:GntR family transcriptional regulator [Methylobacterium pseudosasicola]SFL60511.1 DNA-binding transcriptional regulator, GntR family [Methylobacterium pseudosasicola]